MDRDTLPSPSPSPSRASRPAPAPPRIEAFGATHPGLVRKRNEDAFAVIDDLGLFMIADGMSGRAAGDVAARVALEAVQEMVADPEATMPGEAGLERDAPSLLVAGVHRANARVLAQAAAEPDCAGMGTTFAGVLAQGAQVAIAHVGDSRVYRFRGGRLELLTQDHSLLGETIRSGRLPPEVARRFTSRHAITRAIGLAEAVEVDVRVEAVRSGDLLLLCSDGISGELDDAEIAAILMVRGGELHEAAAALIDRANEKGGADNATVVLVRWGGLLS